MEKKHKILVVEDDPILNMMYRTKLESEGYEVVIAENGCQALLLANSEIELVILDVIIPQLDGFSVLAELKKNNETKKIPVIMLTNLGTEEDRKKGEALGAADYLLKVNLIPEQVSEVIKKYLK